MKDRLAVIADEIDFARRDVEFLARGEGGIGVNVTEPRVELAQFARGDGVLFGDAQDFFPNSGRERDRGVIEKSDVERRRRARDFDEGDVDAVNGRAGHHAENERRFRRHR